MQRRDMAAGQRAIVAARAWMASGETKGRGGKQSKVFTSTAESLAKQFKTSKPSITQARDLIAEAADLASQVELRTLSTARRLRAVIVANKIAERRKIRQTCHEGKRSILPFNVLETPQVSPGLETLPT